MPNTPCRRSFSVTLDYGISTGVSGTRKGHRQLGQSTACRRPARTNRLSEFQYRHALPPDDHTLPAGNAVSYRRNSHKAWERSPGPNIVDQDLPPGIGLWDRFIAADTFPAAGFEGTPGLRRLLLQHQQAASGHGNPNWDTLSGQARIRGLKSPLPPRRGGRGDAPLEAGLVR